ncbi:viroplasmin family protein [Carnobacterium maltaromaticum]|uniref:ribonuclease H1 domain-containing protein n=1 Tax=Carnobacterium maltaromaticum TaxID=2751 RepID=UPI0012FC8A70|nr:ribonuclease H family protein [Carnobacterium maltaromaticum]
MKKIAYYAVREGRTRGIYENWSDAQAEISGYSGAVFKKFNKKEEAESFIQKGNEAKEIVASDEEVQTHINISVCQIYVDGSWNPEKQQYGWGYVAVHNGVSIYKKHGKGKNPEYLSSLQIGGEVAAVLQGLEYAIYKEFQSVEIHYDYSGIENWATGVWSAKKQISQAYKYLYDQKASKIKVTFVKVQAHSGDYFNTLADSLAKRGADL